VENGGGAIHTRARKARARRGFEQTSAAEGQFQHWTAKAVSKPDVHGDVEVVSIVLPIVKSGESVEWIFRLAHRRTGSSTEPRVPNSTASSRIAYSPTNNTAAIGVSVRSDCSHIANRMMTASNIEWAR